MTPEYMKPEAFVNLAYSILDTADVYEDSRVRIRRNFNGLDLEIYRKSMSDVSPDLSGGNPVTMVSKGEIIRHHGEHCWLVTHMMQVDLDKNKILD
jgi:hypothetical protein